MFNPIGARGTPVSSKGVVGVPLFYPTGVIGEPLIYLRVMGITLFHIECGRVEPQFAAKYVQQLIIQRSLKATLRPSLLCTERQDQNVRKHFIFV